MEERVLVQCGHCGVRYKINSQYKGWRAKCRRCRQVFLLTPKNSLDDTVMDWLEDDEDTTKKEKGGSPSPA